MSDLLVAIAQGGDRLRHAELGTPPRMLSDAASCSLSVLALADQADLAVLRAAYDPAPAPPPAPKAAPRLPPKPPGPPPAGPAPGR
ncbi:hypothetical protein ACFU99_12085 [Streptomyces sp. NPDC057654]|uniref:hypothetical protein n=1 Tax=Streptomyces sp. NPDC057654 TaxID=3346196 RepID=UPI0036AC0754